MANVLDDATVQGWVDAHGGWRRDGEAIRRTVECADFPAAIDLVRRVADAAEERDHHPDIDIRWRTVHFALSTHSAGGITGNDLELAEEIDRLAQASGGSGSS